jgi:hypothetical protein
LFPSVSWADAGSVPIVIAAMMAAIICIFFMFFSVLFAKIRKVQKMN